MSESRPSAQSPATSCPPLVPTRTVHRAPSTPPQMEFAVFITQSAPREFYAISAVWILGIPIMDTVYVMTRRLLRGMSPFAPDRRHVHHTLIYIGLSETRTAWLLLAASVISGGIGFAGYYYRVPEYVLTYGFMATFAAYCIFMQHWRVILPLFGIKPKEFVFQPRPVLGAAK